MKLIDYKEKELWRGTIFRFKGKYPFEKIVDFMLVDIPQLENDFALICISGYHAGTLELVLPKEAQNKSSKSISTEWFIKNWNKWVYSECSIYDVLIIEPKVL